MALITSDCAGGWLGLCSGLGLHWLGVLCQVRVRGLQLHNPYG